MCQTLSLKRQIQENYIGQSLNGNVQRKDSLFCQKSQSRCSVTAVVSWGDGSLYTTTSSGLEMPFAFSFSHSYIAKLFSKKTHTQNYFPQNGLVRCAVVCSCAISVESRDQKAKGLQKRSRKVSLKIVVLTLRSLSKGLGLPCGTQSCIAPIGSQYSLASVNRSLRVQKDT